MGNTPKIDNATLAGLICITYKEQFENLLETYKELKEKSLNKEIRLYEADRDAYYATVKAVDDTFNLLGDLRMEIIEWLYSHFKQL